MSHASPVVFPAHRLEVEGLVVERGERLLIRDLGFALAGGELLQVAGRNGAGKTSLLRILCGLSRPLEGRVCWDGVPVQHQEEGPTAHLAYLGHANALKDELSGEENLRIQSALQGRGVGRDEAWEVLGRMGLGGHEDLPVKFLSQGQKRRVALARLLLVRRPLWILDEPFAALDVQVIEVLRSALEAHLAANGMIILTTHQAVPIEGRQRTLTLGKAA
ncbi:heme exporter protein CcmA [Ectothiorhodospira sp. PHS-1]|uniref:cytochrome c biogenesis heme-transporting ATPase CcmA n=1 Tax=Ectothiorhodospira sp. PHS-1 TaxID=519989 RepID=UPI00024A87A9|nr:cytochrome c biogenesis heme-transporting ATPase CcmA [Ectothiorhodospira sp. PHS-1]EHQ52934.1 heme exporter protein CcmA [Ectothiorhodospira sp. PHS-1]